MPGDSPLDAWSVYLENQEVITGVLDATGPWSFHDGSDLVQDFLVDHLPQALRTYDASRPIKPWLFVVFRNFALRQAARRRAIGKRWVSLEQVAEPAAASSEEPVSALQRQAVGEHLLSLPAEYQQTLAAYFGERPLAANVSAIARHFKWSRHRVKQNVLQGLAALAVRMRGQTLLNAEEIDVCERYVMDDQTWEQIARRSGQTIQHLQAVYRSALNKLARAVSP